MVNNDKTSNGDDGRNVYMIKVRVMVEDVDMKYSSAYGCS